MKTFKQLQEDMSKLPKLPGLGGGGGGTDSITDKAPYKSFKKKAIDAVKISTIPARFLLNIKSKPDPTEKFADSRMTPKEKVTSAISDYKRKQKKVNEGVASLAVKSGSKLIPALMTGIGAAGTILQAKRSQDTKASRGRRKNKPKRKISAAEKKIFDGQKKDIIQKGSEDFSTKGLIKRNEKFTKQTTRGTTNKPENEFHTEDAAPTNSMGGGAIAGSVEAGDNPPVNKRKKKGEPTIMARGLLPGARTRFKTGADLFTRIKKNKYS